MDAHTVVAATKKHWLPAVLVVGGFLLYSKFSGSSSATTAATSANTLGTTGTTPVSANDVALAQIAGNIQTAQIQAQTQQVQTGMALAATLSNSQAQLNQQFTTALGAGYDAQKSVATTAIQAASATETSALQSAGAAQASYNQTIGQMGAATGQVVQSIAQANASTASAAGKTVVGLMGY